MSNDKLLLISDPKTGKEVRFAPAVAKDAAILKSAARQGYYYPMLALKQLKSLSAGPNGKNNVFIPDINDVRAHTFQMFYIYLPGIRATIERRANDTLLVSRLEISQGYDAIAKNGEKPGIYSVKKGDANYPYLDRRKNGRITPVDGRVVVVADGNYSDPQSAAADALKRLNKTAGRTAAIAAEFDLVYSPCGQRLGKRNYDPYSITQSFAFAGLLADAMVQSQNKRNIHWIAEFGGSAVFTQAMSVVAQKNVSFAKQNHSAYLYKPTTDPTVAFHLSKKLGFEVGKDFAAVRGLRSNISALIYKAARAKNNDDPYSWAEYSKDLAQGGANTVALAGVGLFVASLAAPAVPAITIAGAVTSGIGSCQLLWTKGKNLFERSKG